MIPDQYHYLLKLNANFFNLCALELRQKIWVRTFNFKFRPLFKYIFIQKYTI